MAQVALRSILSGALVALVLSGGTLVVAQFALAERTRSLASTMPAPAKPASAEPSDRSRTRGVLLRLTDELGRAKVAWSELDDITVSGILRQNWRRHLCPFAGPGGKVGHHVQTISLTRHAEAKRKTGETNSSEEREHRLRDTQTFGLGEGSFDEREAIVLPTPATLHYSVELPKNASLRMAPAVMGDGAVTFEVSCRTLGGAVDHPLFQRTEKGTSKRWQDVTIELGACVGKGELVLRALPASKEPAVGLLGSPVVLGPAATTLPYNVLFVIVDAMRGDAIASTHDPEEDRKRRQAKVPPLDAFIPKIAEIAPNLNALAAEGVIWQNAWSAAMWTRPATVAMLSGMRSSRLGLSVLELELVGNERQRFYASRPPMLPRFFREVGADTAAIVNNMYLSGSVGVGVDYAFESLVDHRYAALDTRYITADALEYLEERRDERFLLLVNYASPHSPYVPPKADLDAIEGASGLPSDPTVRSYLAEIHKDDRAIGELIAKVTALGLREKTLIVVTADHGETMSEAHDIVAVDVAKGVRSGRFTHLSTMWEEAAKVGMVMSLPGKIPTGILSRARVQTLDLLPTILELEGLEVPKGLDGRSLVPLFSGKTIEERPMVVEGRGARSIQVGEYRLIVREAVAQRLRFAKDEFHKRVELYNLADDPGERRDIADKRPEIVEQLRRELTKVLAQSEVVETGAPVTKLHLRVALGGNPGHVELRLFPRGEGKLQVGSPDLDVGSIRRDGREIRVAFDAAGDSLTSLEVELSPDKTELGWDITLDGKPWPKERIFGGVLGLVLPGAEKGLSAALPADALESRSMPHIAAANELGLFVTREPQNGVPELELSAAAQLEAEQAMQAWGYARKTPKKK